MNWLVLALLSALFWGVGQVLIKRGLEEFSPLWNNLISNFLALFIWLPPALWFSHFHLNFPSPQVLLMIMVTAATYMTFYYAIAQGELSLTGTVVAAYPLMTIVLSYLILGERLVFWQFLGIVLVIAGVAAISLPGEKSGGKTKDLSWLKWGLFAAALIGVGDFLAKFSIDQIGAYSYMIFFALAFQPLSILNFLLDKNHRARPVFTRQKFGPTLLGLTLLLCGTPLFFGALEAGLASLVVPISSIYPALTVILAIIFLKDKLIPNQLIGITGVILGIILIGAGG